MKRHLAAWCVSVAALSAGLPAWAQGGAITDLYRELQIAHPNTVPAYDITLDRKGKRIERILFPGDPSARVEAFYEATLDYLRVIRHQGNNSDVLEIALWVDGEGAPLLGVSERRLHGPEPVAGRLRFFSRASGRWNVVTGEVAPILSSPLCGRADGIVDDDAEQPSQPVAAFLPVQDVRILLWCLPREAPAGRGLALQWNALRGIFEPGSLPEVSMPSGQGAPSGPVRDTR